MSQRTPVPALLLLWAVSPAFGLSITEIQYAPGPAERFQFVEVLNDSPAPVDLSGHRFAEAR